VRPLPKCFASCLNRSLVDPRDRVKMPSFASDVNTFLDIMVKLFVFFIG
jgi:hypothetical protein